MQKYKKSLNLQTFTLFFCIKVMLFNHFRRTFAVQKHFMHIIKCK